MELITNRVTHTLTLIRCTALDKVRYNLGHLGLRLIADQTSAIV